MIIMRCLLAILFLFLLGGCAAPEIVPSDRRPVVVSAHRADWDPQGRTFVLKWRFEIAEGWHLYWDGRSDSGAPPTLDFDLPAGWSAGPLNWPAPERLVSPGGILDHVYHERLELWQFIHGERDDETDFRVKIEWLACRDLCVFGDTIIASHEIRPLPLCGSMVNEWTTLSAESLHATWTGGTLSLIVEHAERGLEFMPANDCGPLIDILADGTSEGPRIELRFREDEGRFGPARGIIKPGHGRGAMAWLVDIPAIPATQSTPGGR